MEDENDITMASASMTAALSAMSFDNDADSNTSSEGEADNDESRLNNLILSNSTPRSALPRTSIDDALPPSVRSVSPEPSKPAQQAVSSELTLFQSLLGTTVDKDLLSQKPEVLVVLSHAGYKHQFSRPWVSKKSLASVVERPDRLKACSLGIGLAQTKVPLHVTEVLTRTPLYAPHFEAVHGKDWATELYALCNSAPSKLARGELEVPDSWPYYDIYLAPETVHALEGNISALEKGVDEIFTGDIHRAFIAVRPPGHHCHEDEASGFCIINNAHIAIQYAKARYKVTHAVIMDFDLHHGDGSQDLLWKLGFKKPESDDPIIPMGYFSLHDINSFPSETGVAQPQQIADASVCFVAHGAAIWNVHLKPYATPEEFDKIYETEYSKLFERAAHFLDIAQREMEGQRADFRPLVVVSAGFDGSEFETPGMQRHKVHLPTSFFNRFTRDCVALAENYGSGHLLSVLEGGYSAAAVATGVFSHLTGLSGTPYAKSWCPASTTPHEIEIGMRQRWRHHPEQWSADGVQLGRSLFPSNPKPEPGSPVNNSRPVTAQGRHHLRSMKVD